ncbi:hypothetical protein AB0M42_15405 [Streptomyces sp. NPDC051784]|uniref:hypothetical protein n=1 Tax=Streptomyces sp. NPDC051784 TaxID=3155805 RepID=UPI0034390A07
MRAELMYEADDVRVEDAADPTPEEPTVAIVPIPTTCVCGSDLHGFRAVNGADGGQGGAARVPRAGGTLVEPPVGADDALKVLVRP